MVCQGYCLDECCKPGWMTYPYATPAPPRWTYCMYSTVTTRPPLYPVERAPSDRVGAGADSRAGAPCEATRAGGGAAQGVGPAGPASAGWTTIGKRAARGARGAAPAVAPLCPRWEGGWGVGRCTVVRQFNRTYRGGRRGAGGKGELRRLHIARPHLYLDFERCTRAYAAMARDETAAGQVAQRRAGLAVWAAWEVHGRRGVATVSGGGG